tara:strand:+ start:1103 stop:1333 length:231 start_codon:yes stop_codon:yes gene_type:complete
MHGEMNQFLAEEQKIKPPISGRLLQRGAEWIRTTDSRIFSPMLYQLSYSTLNWRHKSIQKVHPYKTFLIISGLNTY